MPEKAVGYKDRDPPPAASVDGIASLFLCTIITGAGIRKNLYRQVAAAHLFSGGRNGERINSIGVFPPASGAQTPDCVPYSS
jgi:hypothetical protein